MKPEFLKIILKGRRPKYNKCRSIKCEVEFKVKCPLCKTDCNNQMCLKIHLEQICLKLRTCTYCSQLKTFRHVCGQDAHWCGNCNKSVDSYHYCYMLKEEESESVKDKFKGFIFSTLRLIKLNQIMLLTLLWLNEFVEIV